MSHTYAYSVRGAAFVRAAVRVGGAAAGARMGHAFSGRTRRDGLLVAARREGGRRARVRHHRLPAQLPLARVVRELRQVRAVPHRNWYTLLVDPSVELLIINMFVYSYTRAILYLYFYSIHVQ